MPLPFAFDFKNPDYRAVFEWRVERLSRIRANPDKLPALRKFYGENPGQFLIDWGMTTDPRPVRLGRPAWIPFILFPRQEEWVQWFMEKWRSGRPGLCDKSRDMGITWLAIGAAATLCMMRQGLVFGFGSRKQDLVDKIGDPDSIFWKARAFMTAVPPEFRAGWTLNKHAPFMQMTFPDTDSVMKGEAGDNIGRGGRCAAYFLDEAAHVDHPESIDAALSNNTDCPIYLSSVEGMANPFARKRFGGNIDVFTFNWREDPRKDEAWYAQKVIDIDNPKIVAQEIDIDYFASAEGVVIPNEWIQASINAHDRLGFKPTGKLAGALDVADEGRDKNGFCSGPGVLVDFIDEWSGVGSDIMGTVDRAFRLCDEQGVDNFRYDGDGLGAGVRGDARIRNDQRKARGQLAISVEPFRGSEAVVDPEKQAIKGVKNVDYFANRKAQAWWALRERFKRTFRAVMKGEDYDPDELISISSECGNYMKLVTELSQPTYTTNGAGKILIDKTPDGAKSPNLADAVMIRFSQPTRRSMRISDEAMRGASRA